MRPRCVIALSLVLASLALAGCPEPSSPTDSDATSGDEGVERALPELRRVGELAPGPYLFADPSLGDGLTEARLVRVELDDFVVRVDEGAEQALARERAWPVMCLREPLEIREGDLRIELEAGAPVFAIASSGDAVRVGLQPRGEQSKVVWRDAVGVEGCVTETAPGEGGWIGSVEPGDAVCVFADQETLDGWAGVAVPAHASVRILEEDGEWALVEVRAPAGVVRGWMQADRVHTGDPPAPAPWTDAAAQAGRCVFPGRVDGAIGEAHRELEPEDRPTPTIPPHEIERVVRANQNQVYECYETRRRDAPDLSLRLEVVIVVDPDGHVQDVGLPSGGRADAALTQCVVDRIMRWRFPAPRSGSVQIRRAWELRPPADAPTDDAPDDQAPDA